MKICVDPGHGGTDNGAAVDGVREDDLVLMYGAALATHLVSIGHGVVMTRTKDEMPGGGNVSSGLAARARIANEANVDAFVSLHFNASTNPAAKGVWVFHAKGSTLGKALASSIYRRITGDFSDRHVYPDESPACGNRRLYVLRATRAPAVLIEFGFLTNAADRRRMQTIEAMVNDTKAAATGILSWSNQ